MSLTSKLLSASGGVDKLFSDDVFSCFTYTGNGATQTINNGIDLAGKGGLLWLKHRTSGSFSHMLFDTVRGDNSLLSSNNTAAENLGWGPYLDFQSTGFSVGNEPNLNGAGNSMIAWNFRKSPKFFDIVTYTGNGVAGRQIPHALGCEVGMILTKATSTTGDWNTYHRSATGDLALNTTAAQTGSKSIISAASTITFTVNGVANTNGVTYIAHLFAHDASTD